MWRKKLETDLTSLHEKRDVQTLTIEQLLKRKEQIEEYATPDNYEFLSQAKTLIESMSGAAWTNGLEITETNKRKVMIANFRTKIEEYGLNHVSLLVYKTMLYSVNDDFIYYRGALALAKDCILGKATIYKHLELLRNAGLIETVKQGYHFEGWGSNASIRLLG